MATKRKKKMKTCLDCPSMCCKTLSVMIGKPVTHSEIEDLKWQLQFNTVRVYIRSRRWYQLIDGQCIYLMKNSRCKIYADRPDKCRRHNPPDCELYGSFYDVMLETPDDLENYLEKKKPASRIRARQMMKV